MIITAIRLQEKNKERYNIFIDEKYRFSVDEEVLARFSLLKGKTLSENEISEIEQADSERVGLNRAIQFLSHRVRSEKEVRTFLAKHEIAPEQRDAIIQKLVEMDYLDDAEFAKLYVRTQAKTTTKGPKKIERELIEKGIVRELIVESLANYQSDDQEQNALKEASKIARRSRKTAKKLLVRKIQGDLMQKGYSQELAKWASEEATHNLDESDEQTILADQLEKLMRKNKRFDARKAKQKTIQSLMQKGFSYDTIQAYLMENEIDFEEVEEE
ncbi:recombination regulator RecX [Listeria floridensis FSL S10-1187]|uniref:Regulatory protein RecX n=1 Tax=Listeria floridensis FSL S10-1187 TaxID=1265817 RepID=A0ABN0RDI4_9LIST|nr:recombination regulator RecX [Listeria floridensis]EUJ29124.1 recombination regulator RecX [Listeria floridensis FSL S10-1187]